ncbi:unnamed protein product, partial [Discosporangium mesarthrocarpum]
MEPYPSTGPLAEVLVHVVGAKGLPVPDFKDSAGIFYVEVEYDDEKDGEETYTRCITQHRPVGVEVVWGETLRIPVRADLEGSLVVTVRGGDSSSPQILSSSASSGDLQGKEASFGTVKIQLSEVDGMERSRILSPPGDKKPTATITLGLGFSARGFKLGKGSGGGGGVPQEQCENSDDSVFDSSPKCGREKRRGGGAGVPGLALPSRAHVSRDCGNPAKLIPSS